MNVQKLLSPSPCFVLLSFPPTLNRILFHFFFFLSRCSNKPNYKLHLLNETLMRRCPTCLWRSKSQTCIDKNQLSIKAGTLRCAAQAGVANEQGDRELIDGLRWGPPVTLWPPTCCGGGWVRHRRLLSRWRPWELNSILRESRKLFFFFKGGWILLLIIFNWLKFTSECQQCLCCQNLANVLRSKPSYCKTYCYTYWYLNWISDFINNPIITFS